MPAAIVIAFLSRWRISAVMAATRSRSFRLMTLSWSMVTTCALPLTHQPRAWACRRRSGLAVGNPAELLLADISPAFVGRRENIDAPCVRSAMSEALSAARRRLASRSILAAGALLSACHGQTRTVRPAGSAQLGAITIARQACGSCHVIPGIEEADGRVGPPLAHFAAQQTIAGTLPNTPDNLRRFLKSPRTVVKNGAMPDLGLSDDQVRDIAAYLYDLK